MRRLLAPLCMLLASSLGCSAEQDPQAAAKAAKSAAGALEPVTLEPGQGGTRDEALALAQ